METLKVECWTVRFIDVTLRCGSMDSRILWTVEIVGTLFGLCCVWRISRL